MSPPHSPWGPGPRSGSSGCLDEGHWSSRGQNRADRPAPTPAPTCPLGPGIAPRALTQSRVPRPLVFQAAPRRCWALFLTASPAGPWVPRPPTPPPPHIPAVCREEAALLPHRDSALPAPGWGGRGRFPFTPKVPWRHPDLGSAAAPLPMEPALGPGVQVTSRVGGGSQGEEGRPACMCVGRACAWVCLADSARAPWHLQSRKASWRWWLLSWKKVAGEGSAHGFGSGLAGGCGPRPYPRHAHTWAPPLPLPGLPGSPKAREMGTGDWKADGRPGRVVRPCSHLLMLTFRLPASLTPPVSVPPFLHPLGSASAPSTPCPLPFTLPSCLYPFVPPRPLHPF